KGSGTDGGPLSGAQRDGGVYIGNMTLYYNFWGLTDAALFMGSHFKQQRIWFIFNPEIDKFQTPTLSLPPSTELPSGTNFINFKIH
ncbi:hypothetical protein L9F63_014539, partial [Diploptera punctata]